jgi:hypothetical protein
MRERDVPVVGYVDEKQRYSVIYHGTTKREHVADVAMCELLKKIEIVKARSGETVAQAVARQSVAMADALFDELERTK